MKRYEGRMAGVLGTVIIHLLAAILFFTVKLNSLKRENEQEFLLLFDQIMEEPEPVPDITLPDAPDAQSDVDQMIRNIVRNLSNPENPVIDPREYQDMVKEEMIRKGQLTEDNFIDDWKKRQNEEGAIEVTEKLKEEQQKTTDTKPINYQGPTRVYYRLDNRYHTHMPIPVYKCEAAGKVSLSIEVDRSGTVISAKIISSESTTSDQCLLETATKSALESRFNPDSNAPARQTGTLTFHFVAQQ
ncbi:MAG: hypothetical protein IH591_02420 [Bacteroidales bacterium]|nr:hypothetical protein [Bacteroidales bacterium]